MDRENMRAVINPWFHFLGQASSAAPAAAWFRDRMSTQAHASTTKLPQPIPMLNWPPTLFDDAILHH